jgi:hypothetical protein
MLPRRWLLQLLVALLTSAGSAEAQPALIAGGLTALPSTSLGPNLLQNAGFEMLASGVPTSWSAGTGWSTDQLVMHAGSTSYRRTTGAGNASQTLQLSPGTYLLSAWVKTENLGSGATSGVRIMLDFRPGGINAWAPSQVISGTNDWTLHQVGPVVVDTARTAAVRLENYNGAAGTAWFDDVALVQILPQAVDVFLLYPNYRGMLFDDQSQTMRLDVNVNAPGGDFGRYRVRAVLTEEATALMVAAQSFAAAPHLIATLDGSVMQPGRSYLVTVTLVDISTDSVVGTYPPYRVSKVPAAVRATMNVSFDASNRVLLRGVPRFVLGVYDSGMGYSAQDSFWENALWSPTGERRMDDLRINMYLNYWYGEASLEAMNALMTNLQSHGVTYLQTGNCFDKFPAGSNFHINSSDAYVQQLGAHPGSAGYYTIDECVSTLVPGAFAQYDRLRRLDPDSMSFSANFGTPDLRLWRDAVDVIATDPYPLYAAEPTSGYNHRQVADWTALSRDVVKDARPIMTVLQFFKFTSLGRWPTLAEMRNHAYMAVVEGARGLWWWSLGDNALKAVCSDWCAEKTAYMNNLKSVVNEIAALESVLLADDVPGALAGNSNGSIKTKVKLLDGRGYVFAYNAANSGQTATFTWQAAPSSISVNAEARTIVPSGATFGDTFGPFQAHVYVIDVSAPLAVAFTSPAANATVTGSASIAAAASGGATGGYTYTFAVDDVTLASGTASSMTWDTGVVANGPHTLRVTVRDSAGGTATALRAITVSNGPAPSVSLAYNGRLRDRVGRGNTAYSPDGLLDGTFTVTVSGGNGRVVTGLELRSDNGGVWDTVPTTAYWFLGAALGLDSALLRTATNAVNFAVPENGTFFVFGSESSSGHFRPGSTLTFTVRFADDATLTATTILGAALAVTGVSPGHGSPGGSVSVTVAGSGFTSGTTLSLGADISVSNLTIVSPTQLTAMLNIAGTANSGVRDVTVTNAGVGSAVLSGGFTIGTVTMSLAYNGRIRDRVGRGNTGYTADGMLDGTFTAKISGGDGRVVTNLELRSDNGGIWDTVPATGYWFLGAALGFDSALLTTSTISFPVPADGTFVLFGSESTSGHFASGSTFRLTVTFADNSTVTATAMLGGPGLNLAYHGRVRDRVGRGNTGYTADGVLDGTLTATVTGGDGRLVTALELRSDNGGIWDTVPATGYWFLGAALGLDTALLTTSTGTVNFAVPTSGTFVVFGSESTTGHFRPGSTFRLTLRFADNTTLTATTTIPPQ